VREAARGRGYPIITFTVRSRVPGTLEVANGTKVHACLGRDAYVLWRTPRGGVPASEDDFRKARPACIRLERGGVGALRAATPAEAEGAAVPHTDCLLFMKGTDLSAAPEVSVVTLLLEAPSAAVCTAWVAAGLSLLTPLDELLATGAGEAVSSARVDQVVQAVLPPLPASKGDQPNMVCRMLGRRGRRFVLNAQHWLTPATPAARVGATAIGAGADLVDQFLLPAPIVGPALRFGLVVVQLGALAVLAAGHAARCEVVVGQCEGVACDLLDRIFAELRGSLTKFTAAYVKQLCLLMVEVEEVLEEVERMYFSPTLDVGAVGHWELRLKGIGKDQITSSVLAAVGHTTDEIRRKASGIQNELSISRKHVATTAEEPDLSDYEVRWRPPVLDGNYVAGVDSPGRAEHTIVAILEQWDRRADAPRVGVCAIGGSGKSTACAGVAACKQVRALFSRGVIWVQLNESSTMESLSTTAVALVYRLCGEAKAKHLLRLVNRDGFLEMAAGYLRAAEVTDSSEWLLIIDDVRDDQTRLLHQLLRVVPSATPVLFTTRSDVAVASVTGAERVPIESLPDRDARVLLAQALGKQPATGEPLFSQAEEVALVGPVLEWTERHALSLGIFAALIRNNCGEWRPVVAEWESKWMDASITGPVNALDPQRSVRATLELSRALLPDDACRSAFEAVGILPASELVGAHVLNRLWRTQLGAIGSPAGGSSSSPPHSLIIGGEVVLPGVRRLVLALERAGLLRGERANGELAGIVVHPVICGYARRLLGEDHRAAHERLVEEYAREGATAETDDRDWHVYNFWSTPDDGYWYTHVARHAAESGNLRALVSLMSDEWEHARKRSGSVFGFIADTELVVASLRPVVDDVGHKVQADPVLHGTVCWGLASAFMHRRYYGMTDDVDEAITLLQRGLQIVPPTVAPAKRGEMLNDLGNAFLYRVNGDKAANFEEALACYGRALETRTRETAPLAWAETQNVMGFAYTQRVDGDKAANVEEALACYGRTLETWTRETVPLGWATAQHRMGDAYTQRLDGDKAANVEEALACYGRALETRTRETAPLAWAMTQHRMGDAYTQRLDGDKAANVEEALACYGRALETRTWETVPLDWATTQYAMGDAYTQRLDGDKAANVEEALACYGRALETWTRETVPLDWAMTQHRMGDAYTQRVDGDKAANVEEALACYGRALETRTRETVPLDWAMTQYAMSVAYTTPLDGDKAANVEEALAWYGRALETWTRETVPLDWAMTHHRMGDAYTQRLDGDKAANVEEALACYGRALETWTRETVPLDWAMTQHRMGDAYTQRLDGDKAANVEEALACYGRALETRTRETVPLDWATTQHRMGDAYTQRLDGDKAANVEEALACYGRALETRTRETVPLDWATTQHAMGIAYTQRLDGDKAANVEEALACYGRALETRTRETAPLDWATTQRAMGIAYTQRVDGDKAANVEEGHACHRRAGEVRMQVTSPLARAS